MDNIERLYDPAGMHNPMHHGGDFEQAIANTLDHVRSDVTDHVSHVSGEFPVMTQERPVKLAHVTTATLNGYPLLVGSYQPLRKRITVVGACLIGFRGNDVAYNNGAVIGGNYFAADGSEPVTLSYVGEVWINGVTQSATSTVSVMEEVYN